MHVFQHSEPDFLISHIIDEPCRPEDFYMHNHSQAELLLCLNGSGIFHIEGNSYEMNNGDLFFIRPNEAHYFEPLTTLSYDRIVINFDTEVFRSIDPDNRIMRACFDRETGTRNLYCREVFTDDLYQNYLISMVTSCPEERLNILINLIHVLQIINGIFDRGTDSGNADVISEDYKIIRYINSNLSEELSLENISKLFYISPSQLCRLFKKEFGTTINAYITVKRMMYAQKLLKSGKNPYDIFRQCGYKYYSSFYRVYVKHFGHSPKTDYTSDKLK